VNVTLIVQFARGANVAGQLFVWLKLLAFGAARDYRRIECERWRSEAGHGHYD
jgi:hypothetical protein